MEEVAAECVPREIRAAVGGGKLAAVCSWLGSGGAECVNVRIDGGPSPAPLELKNRSGFTLLMKAAEEGHRRTVKALLRHGANSNLQDDCGFTALMWAARYGHAQVVALLLREGAEVDLRGCYGETALIAAVHGESPACVRCLLRAGAATAPHDADGLTAMQRAEQECHRGCVEAFREHFCDVVVAGQREAAAGGEETVGEVAPAASSGTVNVEGGAAVEGAAPQEEKRIVITMECNDGSAGRIYFMEGLSNGDANSVRVWLEAGGPVEEDLGAALPHDTPSWLKVSATSPLLLAAENGHTHLVDILLQHGADVNKKDRNGHTPLIRAAGNNHPAVVRQLLQAGADDAVRSTDNAYAAEYDIGSTALQMAEAKGHDVCVEIFKTHREAYVAAERGDELAVSAWIERLEGCANAKFKIRGRWREAAIAVDLKHIGGGSTYWRERLATSGWLTLLMVAAANGCEGVVNVLLQRGAAANASDGNGMTALMYAALNGHARSCDTLLQHGSDMSKRSHGGWTSLMHAAVSGHSSIVGLLLQAGASLAPLDALGRSALQVAKGQGHTVCVCVIEEHMAAEAARRGEALLAEIEAEERGKESKKSKKKKKKKGKGGGGEAGPSQLPEATAEAVEAAGEAAEAATAAEAAEAAPPAAPAAPEPLSPPPSETVDSFGSGPSVVATEAPAGDAAGVAVAVAAARSEIPPELLEQLQCPLSFEIMTDPVMNAAGQTYERSAIEAWFSRGKRTDPMTGIVLEHTHLVPNVFARSMCRKYSQEP